jgi:hypothetical protein
MGYIIIFSLFCFAYCQYLANRTVLVRIFIEEILDDDLRGTLENIDNGSDVIVDNYGRLPPYHKMLFSFKPLKKEYWL